VIAMTSADEQQEHGQDDDDLTIEELTRNRRTRAMQRR
jgi:hypothetical protein